MAKIDAGFPEEVLFLFEPHRYKGLRGGRGAAKSRSAARALLLIGAKPELLFPGLKKIRVLCARETMRSISDSVHHLLETQIAELGLKDFYEVQKAAIIGANDTEFIFAGLRLNIANIKSTEDVNIVWVEEAQSVSDHSWKTLIPTIRAEGSEIWITWNDILETDATHRRFVKSPPPDAVVKKLTYRDNPWFPEVLRLEMEHLKATDPDEYDHVWEGNCISAIQGAIYAKEIRALDAAGHITKVPYEPSKPVHTFWDLGIGDYTAIWFAQVVGFEYRLIDYEEASGLGLTHYLKLLQSKGYVYGTNYLPHDGRAKELGTGRSIEELMRAAGFRVQIVQKLSVADGINAVRTIMPLCWFDAEKCADGLQALRHYQYGTIETLGVPTREPLHNWASHGSDAFRYFGVGIKTPKPQPPPSGQRPAHRLSAWS